MKTTVAAVAVFCGLLLASCSRTPSDPLCYLRVSELQDSLKAYRDSLHDAQLAWSFNHVTALVKLQSQEVQQGDSCRAQVFIGAANTSDAAALGYRYGEAKLELSNKPEARITRAGSHWVVVFKPNNIGEDSLTGTISLGSGRGERTELQFSNLYKVVPR